jgi:hypothetical protein
VVITHWFQVFLQYADEMQLYSVNLEKPQKPNIFRGLDMVLKKALVYETILKKNGFS